MRNIALVAALAAAISTVGTAAAQDQSVGTVNSVGGAVGDVLVARGSSTFTVIQGSPLQSGDRIFTRTNGSATITAFGCERDLGSLQSILVDGEFCAKPPIILGATSGAATTGTAGAVPAILGVTVVAGAAAIAAQDDDSTSP